MTWSWPTVAETCLQHNKWDKRQLCCNVKHPLLNLHCCHSVPAVQYMAMDNVQRKIKIKQISLYNLSFRYLYAYTLSLTSDLDRGWVVNATPRLLIPGNDSVPTV